MVVAKGKDRCRSRSGQPVGTLTRGYRTRRNKRTNNMIAPPLFE